MPRSFCYTGIPTITRNWKAFSFTRTPTKRQANATTETTWSKKAQKCAKANPGTGAPWFSLGRTSGGVRMTLRKEKTSYSTSSLTNSTTNPARGTAPPPLEGRDKWREWVRVFEHEYGELQNAADLGRPSVLDPYGAESPSEFFAVATECFFERPRELRRRHQELYDQLRGFYRQDPAQW